MKLKRGRKKKGKERNENKEKEKRIKIETLSIAQVQTPVCKMITFLTILFPPFPVFTLKAGEMVCYKEYYIKPMLSYNYKK